MSGKSGGIHKVKNAIFYILIVLVVLLVAGFITFFTNGFTSDFKTFYVKAGEETIFGKKQLDLSAGETRFDVRYTFGALTTDEAKGYSVQVVPNSDIEDFTFQLDGQDATYQGVEDFTDCVALKVYDEYFTLSVVGDETMESLLKLRYPGQTVSGVPDFRIGNTPLFVVQVYSYDKKIRIDLPVIVGIPVTEIELNPGEVIF